MEKSVQSSNNDQQLSQKTTVFLLNSKYLARDADLSTRSLRFNNSGPSCSRTSTALLIPSMRTDNSGPSYSRTSTALSMPSMRTDNSGSSCSNTSPVVQYNNVSDIEDNNQDMAVVPSIESNAEKWTHEATLYLISLYKENSYMLGKFPHKKMWMHISQRMKHEKKYNFSVTQCYNRMDTLKRRYRQIIDHNAQSGNDRKDWIYLEPLDDIFHSKPWVKPLSIAGSNIQEPEKLLFDDNKNEPPTKQKKTLLNEEKAEYLRTSLEEKRLKREETANYRTEKLQILRELKEVFQMRK